MLYFENEAKVKMNPISLDNLSENEFWVFNTSKNIFNVSPRSLGVKKIVN